MKHPPELVQRIVELRNEHYEKPSFWEIVVSAISIEFGKAMSPHAARALYRRSQVKQPTPVQTNADYVQDVANVFYEDKRKPDDIPYDEILTRMFQTVKDDRAKLSIRQSIARVRIETDKPIAVAAITDPHIGSPYTDYVSFSSDITTIKDDPRLFMFKGGDWEDKFMGSFRDKGAPAGMLQPPEIQLLTTKKILRALKGKILAVNGGNHNEMDYRLTGISSDYLIHYEEDFPYLPNGGLVILTVGKIEYMILWKHNYRGNSQISPFNAHRWLRMLNRNADIAILEHIHNPAIQMTEKGSDSLGDARTEIDIRTGTYKLDDKFSEQYFKTGVLGPETVVLYPDRKKMVAFHGREALQDSQRYLDGCEKA